MFETKAYPYFSFMSSQTFIFVIRSCREGAHTEDTLRIL